MKLILTIIIAFFLLGFDLSAQPKADSSFTLTLLLPKTLKKGQHTDLSVQVKNLTTKEFSGMVVLEIISTETNKPIDGWFQNLFPQQYFTIEGGKTGQVDFDIHVPYNVSYPIRCKIVAQVGKNKLSKETLIEITP